MATLTAIGKGHRRTTKAHELVVEVDYRREQDQVIVLTREHTVRGATPAELRTALQAAVDAQLAALQQADDDAEIAIDIVGKTLGSIDGGAGRVRKA